MLKLSPREYQKAIFETAKDNNTLVVLPTGLGKTLVALLVAVDKIQNYPTKKVMMLAPTRPLVEQHFNSFSSQLPELYADLQLFTGSIPASKRKSIFQTADIIFSTPQCIANDLKNGLYRLEDVSLLIIDEAHRCLRNYDYTAVVSSYKVQASNPHILGLTASPGSDAAKIKEICAHLNIEKIELRTRDSEDVKPYLKEREFQKVEVPFPIEFQEIKVLLNRIYEEKVNQLKARSMIFGPVNKITLLKLQNRLFQRVSQRDFTSMFALSLTAQAIKISHAIELLETQTLSGLNEYFHNLIKQSNEKKSKAVQSLVKSPDFNAALISLQHLLAKEIEHPKIEELAAIIGLEIEQNPKAKIMTFCQFRETAATIIRRLNKISNVNAQIFVGQAIRSNSKGTSGLSQKEQKAVIEKFKSGEINVLVATSVHPDEYIVIKKENIISLKKIGEFVNQFLNKNEYSKRIEGYETLTTDGKQIFFDQITDVHKHISKNNCSEIKLNSGFDCLITRDHSLFTFDSNKKFVATLPKENKFISLALKCPNIEITRKIDLIKELPKDTKLFGSIENLRQAKIRQLKTDLKIFSKLETKEQSISDLAKNTTKDYSTVLHCLKRSLKNNLIEQEIERKNYKKITKLNEKGKVYLKFLKWFFNNVEYHKRKYRFKLTSKEKNLAEFNHFFEQKLNVNYGKVKFPRFLNINKYTAKFLGFYVSEGSTRRNKYTSDVFLAARKKHMQRLMEESIEKGLQLKTRKNWRGIAIDSQIAYHLIKDVFKAGIGAYNKEVPEIIFSAPSDIKWEFIKAYFLGDGHIAKDKIIFTTVSRKLVVGLVLLFRMLGIKKITLYKQNHIFRLGVFESLPFAKIKEKNEKRNKAYYGLVPNALESKRAFEKYQNYYIYEKNTSLKCRKNEHWRDDICYDIIKKINHLDKQPEFVYDLSVKKTENFLGGTGLFVLHNSVGEEGLDIPEVSAVIFYEPIPSAIRKIQRAGRTARLSPGKIIMLMTKDTRDIAFHYASTAKEKKMYKIIEQVKKELNERKKDKPQ